MTLTISSDLYYHICNIAKGKNVPIEDLLNAYLKLGHMLDKYITIDSELIIQTGDNKLIVPAFEILG